ncbi:putative nucleic acid-binding protein [Devosia subaequoris]|uniref:Putative nucleic acid-binding protein n=1 Tax=Devosia subaequoris TaxID=395930 RepID=A0A7W6IRW3_9HYPH|nr:putative nucleic acid-binding protein [Devosia subaequoris]MCP1211604.1 hypothetical protein [Devosia subaequoris]
MKRCTIIIPDAGPFNSLWVADRLDLLLKLEMKLVVVDAVYDELTSDLDYPKDRAVKSFIDDNRPPFVVENTEYGQFVRAKRAAGEKVKSGAGETAIGEFMRSDDGLRKYLTPQEPVVLLYEDKDVRVINRPPYLHLLSTVGMLKGLERVGILRSADDVIHQMTHPSRPDRRPGDARKFTDLPEGHDEPAVIGSTWAP